ncbi:hypothetical protein [Actinomadura miaoliensis]|uniref:LysM domain-containing protein n=1 Tax=Actinomadura miaoliensis TaxID=430685 RepID=A0ABP7UZA1_9ACTN
MTRPRPTIGQKYTTQAGDTITEISFVAYGDARRYAELALHNADVPGFNAARVIAGLEIDIPEPDYLPMPRGVGGMRGGIGKSFTMRR